MDWTTSHLVSNSDFPSLSLRLTLCQHRCVSAVTVHHRASPGILSSASQFHHRCLVRDTARCQDPVTDPSTGAWPVPGLALLEGSGSKLLKGGTNMVQHGWHGTSQTGTPPRTQDLYHSAAARDSIRRPGTWTRVARTARSQRLIEPVRNLKNKSYAERFCDFQDSQRAAYWRIRVPIT